MRAQTLLDRLWERHRIKTSEDGLDLIHIDRMLLTDLTGTLALEELDAEGRAIHSPALLLSTPDHLVSTEDGPSDVSTQHRRWVRNLETLSRKAEIPLWSRGSGRQGIVHVVGLESAYTLPGTTLACGDSHTSTHGAVGALAWGIGTSEVKHVLATQTLWMQKPKAARIRLTGVPAPGVYAKDIILWLIGQLGADWARGHAVEFSGPTVSAMTIEERATLCNMAIEMSGRFGIVAPDKMTLDYIRGRDLAPKGSDWHAACEDWRRLRSDPSATFNMDVEFDISAIAPQVTWGTSPHQVSSLTQPIRAKADGDAAALDYIGLAPGAVLSETPVDYVFIGSCANGRLEDLRIAADIVRGHRVHPHVKAWIVPGSEVVSRQAEAEGLVDIFKASGFLWRRPGCSMCVSVNGDIVPPGKRCVSTSNRNFVGRQGAGARTHLASPATAAASALTGRMTDPRQFLMERC